MKTVDYVQLWHDDKQSMLATMYSNLASDIRNGYNPCMDAKAAQKWARRNMQKRGVIS